MSIRIMAQIFDMEGVTPTHKLILLALADHADDRGRCYPSISRLCRRTGLKERAVQTNLKALENDGLISVVRGAGPRGCNVFFVTPTPAADAPPQEMHPRRKCATPPQEMRPTPAADAPKPSGTTIEPSEIPPVSPKAKPPPKAHLPEDWTPADADREYALSQNLTDADIEEIADDFRTYWTERTDARGKKSERGWCQAWKNRVRSVAPQFIRNRRVAFSAIPGGYGQGGGIAGAVARRRLGGQN